MRIHMVEDTDKYEKKIIMKIILVIDRYVSR